MEKRSKHRILGLLVIASLAIILLPLFQNNSPLKPQTVAVQAPPFPAQNISVANNSPQPVQSVLEENSQPSPQEQETLNSLSENSPSEQPSSVPSDTTKPIISTVSSLHEPDLINPEPKPAKQASDPTSQKHIKHAQEAKAKLDSTHNPTKVIAHSSLKKSKIDYTVPHALSDTAEEMKETSYKEAAWVIQIGSYKQKSNALNKVNQLRLKGYPAFLHHTTTASGEMIHVYVGPEKSSINAKELAYKLNQTMQIKGFVTRYKPLSI